MHDGTAATHPRPASPLRLAPVLGVIALAATLAAAGWVVALGMLTRGAEAPVASLPPRGGAFAVGDEVPVSFGAMAVQSVNKNRGLRAKELAGVTHGISGFVPARDVQIDVSVTMTNLLERPAAYSPKRFTLVTSRGKRIAPRGTSLLTAELQPAASVEGRLTFIAPRDGSKLRLEFRDSGRSTPIVVDLGRTGHATLADRDRGHGGHR